MHRRPSRYPPPWRRWAGDRAEGMAQAFTVEVYAVNSSSRAPSPALVPSASLRLD